MRDWLAALPLVPHQQVRDQLHEPVVGLLAPSHTVAVRQGAIEALVVIHTHQEETFARLTPLVTVDGLRNAAVQTLLQIPAEYRDGASSQQLVADLVRLAEATPAEERTSESFVDAMQLADQLFVHLPRELARDYRQRLREITVRVIRIGTVKEEMRYDRPYFAVEAGRPVQIVLQNNDLMPHNLVIVTPGSLQEVAQLGLIAGPHGGHRGKQYVPDTEMVLYATQMVQPDQQAVLTFDAPTEPGEYPYVCTFPAALDAHVWGDGRGRGLGCLAAESHRAERPRRQ